MKHIYVRQAVQSWATLEIGDGFGGFQKMSQLKGTKAVGMLLVYSTKKDFKKEHPKETPLRMSKVNKPQ